MTARRRSPAAAPVRWAAITTALVLLSWLTTAPPLRDAASLRPVSGATLTHSAAYLALAPLCNVMDALTLLSVSQTVALLLSLIVVYVLWRALGRRGGSGGRRAGGSGASYGAAVHAPTRSPARSIARTAVRELALAILALLFLVAFFAAAILVPRPMAALALADSALLTVDFHSHTAFSHDARRSFDVRANRDWHRDAGFDVAYITDHKSFAGAALGMRGNPPRAGDGLVLLSGLELVADHDHLNALGATARDSLWLSATGPGLRDARARALAPTDTPPIFVQTIPENLARLPAPDSLGANGVLAIELSDGSPRGIEQEERDRAHILRLADSLDLSVVAGSDNHGWGRTAVAWSVLRIPGWRTLSPDALGLAIAARIRGARRRAVEVIERRSPIAGRRPLALAVTLPAVAWNMLATLEPAERAAWIAWAWVIVALAALIGARRGTQRSPRRSR